MLSTFGFVEIWANGIYGADFSEIWAGPHVFVGGANPYDPSVWSDAVRTLGVQHPGVPTYNYPAWIPLLLAPFGALDLTLAARVWLGAGLLVAAVGLFLLLDDATPHLPLAFTLFAFALVGSEPGIVTFYSGQWGFLQVGLLSLAALALRRGRERTAGLLAGVMITKPHLFLGAGLCLLRASLRRSDRRFAAALIGVAVAAPTASAIVFPFWWSTYLSVPAAGVGDPRAAALPNGMRDLFGTDGLILGVAAGVALVLLALAYPPRSRAFTAVWLSATYLLAPYIFVYDHLLMLVPLVLATGLIAERGTREALLFAAVAFALLVAGATLVHAFPGVALRSLGVNGFVLYALVAMVVGALWPWRRAVDSATTTSSATPAR